MRMGNNQFAKNLKFLRAIEWTQEEFAQAIGVSRNAVYYWEAGERMPGPRYLRKIARALKVKAKQLKYGNLTTNLWG